MKKGVYKPLEHSILKGGNMLNISKEAKEKLIEYLRDRDLDSAIRIDINGIG